jgi:hypothetical protein
MAGFVSTLVHCMRSQPQSIKARMSPPCSQAADGGPPAGEVALAARTQQRSGVAIPVLLATSARVPTVSARLASAWLQGACPVHTKTS